MKELVLMLRQIDIAAGSGRFDEAGGAYAAYRQAMAAAVPLLTAAEPWSLFNPAIRDAYYAALRQMTAAAKPRP